MEARNQVGIGLSYRPASLCSLATQFQTRFQNRFLKSILRTIAGLKFSTLGKFSPALGARNQAGIGLSYRAASLCCLATQFQSRFLELIPRPIMQNCMCYCTLHILRHQKKNRRFMRRLCKGISHSITMFSHVKKRT
jgi:hypothetical protein